ncbi:hypothetical protein L218DRAFT_560745 [Marasmius fiardii PR-910]|nr:hypothetical protein L218DRAFT_560745 [Marasmius fiardii PR-910]
MPLRTLFSKKSSSSSSPSPYGQSFATKSQASLHLNASITPESPSSAEYVNVSFAATNVPSSPNGRSSLHPNHAYQSHSSTSPSKASSVYSSIANSPSSTTSASSSRLKLFGRKKDRSAQSVKSSPDNPLNLLPPVLPPFTRPLLSDAISDPELPLAPPQLGQVLNGGASTRSLPNTNTERPELKPLNTFPVSKPLLDNLDLTTSPTSTTSTSNGTDRIDGKDNSKKKTSLFSWSKSESKASGEKVKKANDKGKRKEVDTGNNNGSMTEESFNLKSFRHIQASPSPSASPGASPNPPSSSTSPYGNPQSSYLTSRSSQHLTTDLNSSTSLIPPPPLNHPTARPRNTSTDSQTQRISVAAFREAQARRSMAGSPVFDGRVSPGPSQGMHSRSQVNLAAKRVSRTFTSEEDSSEEEEEEEDSDDVGAAGLSRKRTVTGKSYMGARSESGRGRRSDSGHKSGKSETGHGGWGKTKSEVGHGSNTTSGEYDLFSMFIVAFSSIPSIGKCRALQLSLLSPPSSAAPSIPLHHRLLLLMMIHP